MSRDEENTVNDAHDSADHPHSTELLHYADGEIIAGQDRPLIEHIASCSECSDEIERLRNSAAALALMSAPPSDLFDRILARRAASRSDAGSNDPSLADSTSAARHPTIEDLHRVADGEVQLENDLALLQHVSSCAACSREIDEARLATARLALASKAPDDLFERIQERRRSGERVLVPFASDEGDARDLRVHARHVSVQRSFHRRRLWGWAAAAAVVLLAALGVMNQTRAPQQQVVATRSGVLGDSSAQARVPTSDSTPTAAPPLDASGIAWRTLTPAAQRQRLGDTKRALVDLLRTASALSSVTQSGDTLLLPLSITAFVGDAVSDQASEDLRALGAILHDRPELRIVLIGASRNGSDNIAALRLRNRLGSVRDAILRSGIYPARVQREIIASSVQPTSSLSVLVAVLPPARESKTLP